MFTPLPLIPAGGGEMARSNSSSLNGRRLAPTLSGRGWRVAQFLLPGREEVRWRVAKGEKTNKQNVK